MEPTGGLADFERLSPPICHRRSHSRRPGPAFEPLSGPRARKKSASRRPRSSQISAIMAAVKSSVAEQIRQLNDARKHVLLDPKVYSSIVQGVLPIIGPSSVLELRRWGSDFLAEAFATPSLPLRDKETLSLLVLETLRAMIENPKEIGRAHV